MIKKDETNNKLRDWNILGKSHIKEFGDGKQINLDSLTPKEMKEYIKTLRNLMHDAARNLDFEEAARIRDIVKQLE
jgi:excinuclease UvrABC helicase subunit UvrB